MSHRLDDRDAEAVVLEVKLTERELLTLRAAELRERGLPADLVAPLRSGWVGSPKPLSRRWARAIGMAAVNSLPQFNIVLGGTENRLAERLKRAGVKVAPAEPGPLAQYQLAMSVFRNSFELGIEGNARLHGIRWQEVAIYRRRFARMVTEMEEMGAAPEDAPGLWHEVWAPRGDLLCLPWTPSPTRMWALLAGSRL